MILLFCMQRPDVLSYDDLAIQRGLRMLYHHRKIDRRLFEKYRRRYRPYGSVASLYLWAIAGGAIPGMRDYAPLSRAAKNRKPSELHGGAAMLYTGYYHSPLGRLLLAADEIGLTGLWLRGSATLRRGLPRCIRTKKRRFWRRQDAGWISISAAVCRTLRRRSIRSGRTFGRRYGRCCCRSPTEKPRPTVHLPTNWPKSTANAGCPRRRWAALSGTMRSRSSYPATVLSGQTAA